MLSDRVRVELSAHRVANTIGKNGVMIVVVSPKMPAGLGVRGGVGVRGERVGVQQVATIETVTDNNGHDD